jgi:hypothetical protein
MFRGVSRAVEPPPVISRKKFQPSTIDTKILKPFQPPRPVVSKILKFSQLLPP